MPKLAQVLRSIFSNWAAMAVGMAVAFFLSPFVVHRLGTSLYGIWVLLNSMVAYMVLLDLGLRGAVVRFVTKNYARADHQAASRAVSAALWLRLATGVAVLVFTLVIAFVAPNLFHIPKNLKVSAQCTVVIIGVTFAINLASGVFGAVLASFMRFDLMSATSVFGSLLRAVGTVWLLNAGYGIVSLALLQLAAAVLSAGIFTWVAFRAYPQLRITLAKPDSQLLSQFWSYSSWAFIINICSQLVWYTDNLVVGAVLSATAVAFYAIGGNLIEYTRQIVASVTATFGPLASDLETRGKHDELRRLVIQGTRAALAVALPFQIALFFRGRTFISLWMGAEFGPISGRVLQILLLSQLLAVLNYTMGVITVGVGRHKPLALWGIAEALTNLALSILLVRRIGLTGAAWGTLVPALVIHFICWPRQMRAVTGLTISEYTWQGWARPIIASIPFAVACVVADHYWQASGLVSFFLQIAATLPLFVFGMLGLFRKEFASHLHVYFSRRRDQALSRGAAIDGD